MESYRATPRPEPTTIAEEAQRATTPRTLQVYTPAAPTVTPLPSPAETAAPIVRYPADAMAAVTYTDGKPDDPALLADIQKQQSVDRDAEQDRRDVETAATWEWLNRPINLGHLRENIAANEALINAGPTLADNTIQRELIQRTFTNPPVATSGGTVGPPPAASSAQPAEARQGLDPSQQGPNPGGDFWNDEDDAEPEMNGEPDPAQQAATPADPNRASQTPPQRQPAASLHTSIDGGYTVFEWTDGKGVKHEDRIATLVQADHRSRPDAAGEIHSTVRGVLHGRAALAYGPEGSQIDTGDSRGRWIHGGGTSLHQAHAYDPAQRLTPTFGCTRGHNSDVARLGREITEFQNANPGVQIPYTRTKQ